MKRPSKAARPHPQLPLTVIITTKDEPEAFRLIGRICEQVAPGDEVIIEDDQSQPEFIEGIKFYRAVYPCLQLVSHALNDDFSTHRNYMHEVVPRGRWMVLLDADEWVSMRFLGAIRRQIALNPEVDVFGLARVNTEHAGNSWMQPVIDWENIRSAASVARLHIPVLIGTPDPDGLGGDPIVLAHGKEIRVEVSLAAQFLFCKMF